MRSRGGRCWAVLAVILSVVSQACAPGTHSAHSELSTEQREKIERIIRLHRDSHVDQYKLFQAPSYPPPSAITLVPEWQPSSSVLLAYPQTDLSTAEMDEVYVSLIGELRQYVNIVIIVPDRNLTSLNQLIALLRQRKMAHLVDDGTVRFLIAPIDTIWVRDYGPLFGFDGNGQAYLIDTKYYDVRVGAARERDDVVPSYLLDFLREETKNLQALRPPLALDGGDFYADDKGACFTSTETLLRNGGNEEDTNLVFRHYFGCQQVVYLKPLPGPTVKHIDMFFKLVDSNTVLLGDYQAQTKQSSPTWYLQKQAKAVLDSNAERIERSLRKIRPSLKILRVPMPDIQWEKDLAKEQEKTEALLRIIKQIFRYMAREDAGVSAEAQRLLDRLETIVSAWEKSKDDEKKAALEKSIVEHIVRLRGALLDIGGEVTQDINRYFSLDYHKFYYPTYLNATFVGNAERRLLLVPRFSDLEHREGAIRQMYEQVYPRTKIVFINADYLMPQHGAVHCITHTIPRLSPGQTLPVIARPAREEETSESATILAASAEPGPWDGAENQSDTVVAVPPDLLLREDPRTQHAQRLLGKLGLDPGPADGIWGGKTERAIREFQRRTTGRQLDATGALDGATYAALEQAASRGVWLGAPRPTEPETPTGMYEVMRSTLLLGRPNEAAGVITRLEPPVRIRVIGAVGEYLEVRSRGERPSGYVHRSAVRLVRPDNVWEG